MTILSSFALSFGLLLAGVATIAAWLFRTSSAPLWMKLVVPALIVALAGLTPYRVFALLGLPEPVAFAALPDKAELLAFVPHDEAGLVDLWLSAGDALPRAYETPLDPKLKQALREARERMDRGGRAMLVKRSGRPDELNSRATIGNADEASEYVLAPDAILPNKE